MRALIGGVLVLLAAAACTSPEATRVRGGDRGADVGNVGPRVEMHAGSQPYWETPRLVEPGGPMPAALPRPASDATRDARQR